MVTGRQAAAGTPVIDLDSPDSRGSRHRRTLSLGWDVSPGKQARPERHQDDSDDRALVDLPSAAGEGATACPSPAVAGGFECSTPRFRSERRQAGALREVATPVSPGLAGEFPATQAYPEEMFSWSGGGASSSARGSSARVPKAAEAVALEMEDTLAYTDDYNLCATPSRVLPSVPRLDSVPVSPSGAGDFLATHAYDEAFASPNAAQSTSGKTSFMSPEKLRQSDELCSTPRFRSESQQAGALREVATPVSPGFAGEFPATQAYPEEMFSWLGGTSSSARGSSACLPTAAEAVAVEMEDTDDYNLCATPSRLLPSVPHFDSALVSPRSAGDFPTTQAYADEAFALPTEAQSTFGRTSFMSPKKLRHSDELCSTPRFRSERRQAGALREVATPVSPGLAGEFPATQAYPEEMFSWSGGGASSSARGSSARVPKAAQAVAVEMEDTLAYTDDYNLRATPSRVLPSVPRLDSVPVSPSGAGDFPATQAYDEAFAWPDETKDGPFASTGFLSPHSAKLDFPATQAYADMSMSPMPAMGMPCQLAKPSLLGSSLRASPGEAADFLATQAYTSPERDFNEDKVTRMPGAVAPACLNRPSLGPCSGRTEAAGQHGASSALSLSNAAGVTLKASGKRKLAAPVASPARSFLLRPRLPSAEASCGKSRSSDAVLSGGHRPVAAPAPTGEVIGPSPAPAPPLRRRLTGKQPPPTPNPWAAPASSGAVSGQGQWALSSAAAHGKRKLSCCQVDADDATAVVESMRHLCITATGLVLGKKQRQLLERMGASVVDEWSPNVTHLVTSSFRRTTKMMCAICTGAHVVILAFLDACCQAGGLVDDEPFRLQDDGGEAAFARKQGLTSFSLQAALGVARSAGPLLAGKAVHWAGGSAAARQELCVLVQTAGGQWLSRAPSSKSRLSFAQAAADGHPTTLLLCKDYNPELLREAACTQVLRYSHYKL
ncbi:unnamed protein product [Polarella glacialis]|uniref:BRCT domain-containing protein n=1 Tax=Polarella glacialis TaxID=89957 RepID=A0A813FIR6_POLGL|nr:unnamed protein product [Polarella glacialis]